MYRTLMEKLKEWRTQPDRSPLILRGARQVGKTYLVKEFGKNYFENIVEVNFEKNPSAIRYFDGDLDPGRIIRTLSIAFKAEIKEEKTLIFFDEVHDCPRALTSLKYFKEDSPQYAIIAAGSLLGIQEHKGLSFPVGKVSFLELLPFSFCEFLMGIGEEGLADELENGSFDDIALFGERYLELLKEYLLVGGMPQCILKWKETSSFEKVRIIQDDIVESYLSDLSKHIPPHVVVRCREIVSSIASQLGKDNKKFIFSHVREGGRAKDYEEAFAWLESCRIINKVKRVTIPRLPLTAYEEQSVFKVYMHDVGLLSSLLKTDTSVFIEGNSLFDAFRRTLMEQFVLTELRSQHYEAVAYYANDKNTAEIDFLVEDMGEIIPLEVKSGINTKAKSLRSYNEKFRPLVALRTSPLPYIEHDWVINIPLYALKKMRNVIDTKKQKA